MFIFLPPQPPETLRVLHPQPTQVSYRGKIKKRDSNDSFLFLQPRHSIALTFLFINASKHHTTNTSS